MMIPPNRHGPSVSRARATDEELRRRIKQMERWRSDPELWSAVQGWEKQEGKLSPQELRRRMDEFDQFFREEREHKILFPIALLILVCVSCGSIALLCVSVYSFFTR